MARLPSEMFLVQQVGEGVVLFEDFTEREIARFNPASAASSEAYLAAVRESELGDEDQCYAQFWAGYFAAYAGHPSPPDGCPVRTHPETGRVYVYAPGVSAPVASFDPRDQNATAQAQKPIHDSGLSDEDRGRAHFWCGFFYARAS